MLVKRFLFAKYYNCSYNIFIKGSKKKKKKKKKKIEFTSKKNFLTKGES